MKGIERQDNLCCRINSLRVASRPGALLTQREDDCLLSVTPLSGEAMLSSAFSIGRPRPRLKATPPLRSVGARSRSGGDNPASRSRIVRPRTNAPSVHP